MSRRWLGPVLILMLLALPVATATAHDDDDRLPDRWERRHGLPTSKPSGKYDPDGDKLSNRREYLLRTHPRRRDTDGDGLGDRGELERHRTNPRKRDTDGDGYSDRAEIRAGTNPRRRSSRPSGGSTPTPAPPSPGASPRPSNVGVPAGWAPAQTRSSDLVVAQAGAVVQDVLLTRGNIVVNAPNVTLRRVKLQGGRVINTQGSCKNGLLVEDSTFEPAPGQQYANDSEGMTGTGGYTARRVLVWRRTEGFRVGGKGDCGPVSIEDSFAKIAIPPGCPGDPHSDGIQGYHGPALSVRNVTIDFREASCGTAPFFVPHSQGNTSVDVNGLLVMGGGYSFRLGVPGAVRGLKIVDDSWHYGPVDVRCSGVSGWDAQLVTITPDYQVSGVRSSQGCRGTGG